MLYTYLLCGRYPERGQVPMHARYLNISKIELLYKQSVDGDLPIVVLVSVTRANFKLLSSSHMVEYAYMVSS